MYSAASIMACCPVKDRCNCLKIAACSFKGIASLLSKMTQLSTSIATGQNWETCRPCLVKVWTSLSRIARFIGLRNSSLSVSSASKLTSNRLDSPTNYFLSCETNSLVLIVHTLSLARSWRAWLKNYFYRHFSIKIAIDWSRVLGGPDRFLFSCLQIKYDERMVASRIYRGPVCRRWGLVEKFPQNLIGSIGLPYCRVERIHTEGSSCLSMIGQLNSSEQ